MNIGERIQIQNDQLEGLYARWARDCEQAKLNGYSQELPEGIYEAVAKDDGGVLLADVLASDCASDKHRYYVLNEELNEHNY